MDPVALQLIKTSTVRGLASLLQIQKLEYILFLQENGFLKQIQEHFADEGSRATKDVEGNYDSSSAKILEQRIQQLQTIARKKLSGDQDLLLTRHERIEATLSGDRKQLLVKQLLRQEGLGPRSYLSMPVKSFLGPKELFDEPEAADLILYPLIWNPKANHPIMAETSNYTFVIESSDLMTLRAQIIDTLRGKGDDYSNTILTDDQLDMDKFLENMKTVVTHNFPFEDLTESVQKIFDRRIIIVEKTHFDSINRMLKNQELEPQETKGYLLTQIAKCLNEDKDELIKGIQDQFLEIPNDTPYQEILSKLAPAIMETYVVTKFVDESEEEQTKARAHMDSIFKAITEKTALPIKVDEQKTEEVKANLLSKIGALMGSNQKKSTPDFAEILTKNDGLTKMASEEAHWYNAYTTSKLSEQELYENYRKEAWIGEKTDAHELTYDLYLRQLAQLEKSYSRQALLSLLKETDPQIKDQLQMNKIILQKVCDLLHLRLCNGNSANLQRGNTSLAKNTESDISLLLENLSQKSEFTEFFVDDFLQRGRKTCEKIMEKETNEIEELITCCEQFLSLNLKTKLDMSDALLPHALIYFSTQILEKGYIKEKQTLLEFVRACFNLSLAYSILFMKEEASTISQDLVSHVNYLIGHVKVNLDEYVVEKVQLGKIFSSKILQSLMTKLDVEKEDPNTRQKRLVGLLIRMRKISEVILNEHGPENKYEIELPKSMKQAMKNIEIIEQGGKFKRLLTKIQFNELLQSEDRKSVGHLGQGYQTDDKMYSTLFKKEFEATDHDLVLRITEQTSEALLKAKIVGENGKQIQVDKEQFATGKDISLRISKGEKCEIEFPIKPATLKTCGQIYYRWDDTYKSEYTNFSKQPEVTGANPVKVLGHYNSLTVIGEDSSIWGRGWKIQGEGEQSRWRKFDIDTNCKKIKKVVVGKFNRAILDVDGNVFFQGRPKSYMMGMNADADAYLDKFTKVQDDFYPRTDQSDKFVDIALGKRQIALVTQSGKVYGSSYQFYRNIQEASRKNEQDNEDYPFEIILPSGWKAAACFCPVDTYEICYIDAVRDGKHKMFSYGTDSALLANGGDSQHGHIMKVPEGIYMTKIENHRNHVAGMDQNGDLWHWGDIYAKQDGVTDIYQQRYIDNYDRIPLKFQWFKNQKLKLLDFSVGWNFIVTKCQSLKDDSIAFYVLANCDSTDINQFGGKDAKKIDDKYNIYKLDCKASDVISFSCSRHSTNFVIAGEVIENTSIVPGKPDELGLIHFYKQDNEWKYMTQEEYQDKKGELPDLSFACRYPIENFKDKTFPDLEALLPEIEIDESPTATYPALTYQKDPLPSTKPLYYANAKISGRDVKIYASEEEVLQSGQPFDMKPLIFYRISKPAKHLGKLPMMNLPDYFKQKPDFEKIGFSILKADISEDDMSSIVISDKELIEKLNFVKSMGQDQDQELLQQMDKVYQLKNLHEKSTFSSSAFDASSFKFDDNSKLKGISKDVIALRVKLLAKFTKAFQKTRLFVDENDMQHKSSFSYQHFNGKKLVIPSITNTIVNQMLEQIDSGSMVYLSVSRRKAMVFADEGKVDHEGKYTIFGQIMKQCLTDSPDMTNFRQKDPDSRCYKVDFKGEGSMDYGGPFRDSLSNIARELEESVLPILVKTPNNRNEHGSFRDCYILNGASKTPSNIEMFKFFGGFIAYAIMSKSPVPFNLAPIVWKQLLNEKPVLEDLNDIDAYSCQVLKDLQQHASTLSEEHFNAAVDQTFTTILSSGEEVPLCEDGESKQVTMQNLGEFINLVLKARFTEADEQLEAIKQGMNMVLDNKLTQLSLLSWRQVEIRACGSKSIDVDKLKSITSYSSCSETDEQGSRFWRVFEAMNDEQRSLYLKFVWGRSRLPLDLTKLEYKHEVRLMGHMGKTDFPQAHTCFFQLDLPPYETDEMCSQRLIAASELCGGIDTDHGVGGIPPDSD